MPPPMITTSARAGRAFGMRRRLRNRRGRETCSSHAILRHLQGNAWTFAGIPKFCPFLTAAFRLMSRPFGRKNKDMHRGDIPPAEAYQRLTSNPNAVL